MNELTHWGIKGMRWGRRRFQNTDGTLTEAGKQRYNDTSRSAIKNVLRGAAIVSSMMAAPFIAVTSGKLAQFAGLKGEKKAAVMLGTSLGTVGITTLAAVASSERTKREHTK